MKKVTMYLDDEESAAFVVAALKDTYIVNEAFPNEGEYKKLRKALRTVIRFYSTPDDWDEFCEVTGEE